MFHFSSFAFQQRSPHSSTLLSQEEQSATILINRIRANRKKRYGPGGGNGGLRSFFRLRAVTASHLQTYVILGGMVFGAAVVLGPWMIREYKELLGLYYTPLDPSHQPGLSVQWWESEWRKMNPTWRRGESVDDFYEAPFAFVASRTGRDIHSAASFRQTHPSYRDPPLPSPRSGLTGKLHDYFFSFRKSSGGQPAPPRGKEETDANPPRVLIPLCGDTPLLAHFAAQGYQVDGIDGSQTAIRAAVERTERVLPMSLFHRVRLHWDDFFSPALWEKKGPLALVPSTERVTGEDAPMEGKRRSGEESGTEESMSSTLLVHSPRHAPHRGASSSSSPTLYDRVDQGDDPATRPHAGHRAEGPLLSPTFDLIYERQGLTSVPFAQRENYAYLLQRALKPDGILYVEGIFRTGRVANNKHAGPPFGLSRKELRRLFGAVPSTSSDAPSLDPSSSSPSTSASHVATDPLEEGHGSGSNASTMAIKKGTGKKPTKMNQGGERDLFSGFEVECEERNDALTMLSREDRVLRRIPKELYVTPFHCVIYRKGAVNAARVKQLAEERVQQ